MSGARTESLSYSLPIHRHVVHSNVCTRADDNCVGVPSQPRHHREHNSESVGVPTTRKETLFSFVTHAHSRPFPFFPTSSIFFLLGNSRVGRCAVNIRIVRLTTFYCGGLIYVVRSESSVIKIR